MEEDKSKLLRALFINDEAKEKINLMTEKIIGCSYKVANGLGCGFLEKVYENALAQELQKVGLRVERQKVIKVHYDDVEVGYYEADLLIESCVLVELKTVKNLDDIHKAQGLNYLKATGLKICLLINFGNPKVEVRRIVL